MKDQKPYIIGSHLFFLKDGSAITSPEAGTSGRGEKPDRDEETLVDLGIIENIGVDPVMEEREIYGPAPGRYVLQDILTTRRGLTVTAQLGELGPLAVAHIFGSAEPDGSDEYVPGGGTDIKGWLLIDQYDEDNVLRNQVDLYVHTRFTGPITMGDDVVRPTLTARLLHSAENHGELITPE